MGNFLTKAISKFRGSGNDHEPLNELRVAGPYEVSVNTALQRSAMPSFPAESVATRGATVGLQDATAWLSYFGLDSSSLAVNPNTALGLTTFQSCLDIVSSAIAQVPLGVYEDTLEGKRPAPDHSLNRMLKVRPDRHMNSFVFRKTLIIQLLVFGHAVAEIKRGSGNRPESFRILQPNDYMILESREGDIFYRKIDGTLLQEEDVIHLKGISLDGKYAKGLPQMHKRIFKMGFGSQEFLAKYYEKGTHLQGYLVNSGKIQKEDARAFSDAWDGAYSQGVEGMGRTPFLHGGTEYKAITRTPVESQLVEFLSMHPTEIYRMFRVPPHLTGDTTKATSFGKGLEELSTMFVTFTLIPLAIQLEQELDYKGFRESEIGRFYTKHNFNGLMRGDFAGRMEGYTKAIQAGIYSPNEVRALEEAPRYEGGDEHVFNGNMISVSQVNQKPDSTAEDN